VADDKMTELDEIALQIYAQRQSAPRISGESDALDCYRRADAFLAVRAKVRKGELKAAKPTGPQLSDCCAPNLRKNHPLNLVSQKYGDLGRVDRIAKWLDTHPTPERDPEDLVIAFNREHGGLDWALHEIATARLVFPTYATKN
jgi:hypothetical protein